MSQSRKDSRPAKTQPVITDKLKILCLHGYRQNADGFKSKIGSFRKMASKYADLVFVSAPLPVPGDEDGQLSWWFNKDDGTFKGTNKSGPAIGFADSLALVESTWAKEGPFQGLLGFSQGACFVGLLCDLSSRGMTSITPQFAICSSGFKSGSLAHLNYYCKKIEIPSLHIFGATDDIIPQEMSQALANTFADPQIVVHSGGHYFAATAKEKQTYINFLQDRLQDYLEAKELASNSVTAVDDGGEISSGSE